MKKHLIALNILIVTALLILFSCKPEYNEPSDFWNSMKNSYWECDYTTINHHDTILYDNYDRYGIFFTEKKLYFMYNDRVLSVHKVMRNITSHTPTYLDNWETVDYYIKEVNLMLLFVARYKMYTPNFPVTCDGLDYYYPNDTVCEVRNYFNKRDWVPF